MGIFFSRFHYSIVSIVLVVDNFGGQFIPHVSHGPHPKCFSKRSVPHKGEYSGPCIAKGEPIVDFSL